MTAFLDIGSLAHMFEDRQAPPADGSGLPSGASGPAGVAGVAGAAAPAAVDLVTAVARARSAPGSAPPALAGPDVWAVPGVPRPAALRVVRPSEAVASVCAAVVAVPAAAPDDPVVALADTRALLVAAAALQAAALDRLADVRARALHTLTDAPSTAAWLRRSGHDVDPAALAAAGRLARHPAVRDQVTADRAAELAAAASGIPAGGQACDDPDGGDPAAGLATGDPAAGLATGDPAGGRPVARGIGLRQADQLCRALDRVRPHLDRPDGLIDGLPGAAVLEGVAGGAYDLLCEARGGVADDDPLLAAWSGGLAGALTASTQTGALERLLLVVAAHLDPVLLPAAVTCLTDALLPVQLQQRSDAAHRERGLTLRRDDAGGWRITRGRLDDQAGELLQTVLTACGGTDPANPQDTAAWAAARADGAGAGGAGGAGGGGADGGGAGAGDARDLPPARSRAQRDHDALALGLRTLLDSGALGSRGKAVPHVGVLVTVDQLAALDDAGPAPGALPARSTTTGCSLAGSVVRRWLADSALVRLVTSLGRRVVETSHTQRTLTATERRLLHAQWGGRCAGAGCAHDSTHGLVPHHGQAWALTGTTSLEDSVPVCDPCHAHVHRHGRLRLRDGRVLRDDRPP